MEIRDKREKGWFHIDNEYLNGYGKLLGPSCTLTYITLCRFANEGTQTCFPEMRTIAEEVGLSKITVLRALKVLEEWNIIHVEKRKVKGKQISNLYTLLSKKVWKEKPSIIEIHRETEYQKVVEPSIKNDENRVSPQIRNNTNITILKEQDSSSNAQGIAEIIKSFVDNIDVKNKRFYGNTTQRKAAEFLIQEYGLETVLDAIKIIPQIKPKIPYFPSITTPHELVEKWTKIKDAIDRVKQNTSKQMEVIW